jgi:hypothetical protein
MSVQVPNRRFIQSSLDWAAEFYQYLFKRGRSFHELGNRLVSEAKQAIAFRQADRLNELGLMLSNLPIKEYQLIGQYYRAWSAYRSGDMTRLVFEKVAEESATHRASALITLAALEARKGNYELEYHFLIESVKYADSLSTAIRGHKGIAVIKAKEGYHQAALKDFKNLFPMIRHASVDVYFDFLNSYAVELGEAGHKQEARNIIRHVVASPFAAFYPEWQETARDLKEPNRSSIAVPLIEREPIKIEAHAKVLSIESHPDFEPEESAKVISFPELKEAPRPDMPKLLKSQELEYMNVAERRELIMAAIKSGAVPESQYKRAIYLLGLVESGPANQILDLEDAALLSKIIMKWCNLIEPEQFTAVLSALRDCKDDLRRNEIINLLRNKGAQGKVCHVKINDEPL